MAPKQPSEAILFRLPDECLPPREPPVSAVIDRVAHAWGLTPAAIRGRERTRRVSDARAAAVRAVYSLCPSSTLAELAKDLRRDHATILYLRGRGTLRT